MNGFSGQSLNKVFYMYCLLSNKIYEVIITILHVRTEVHGINFLRELTVCTGVRIQRQVCLILVECPSVILYCFLNCYSTIQGKGQGTSIPSPCSPTWVWRGGPHLTSLLVSPPWFLCEVLRETYPTEPEIRSQVLLGLTSYPVVSLIDSLMACCQ